MHRNFGVSRRPALGAHMQGGAPLAHGALREARIQSASYRPSCSVCEYATMGFIGLFGGAVAAILWFLTVVIDWDGVGETLSRFADLG